MIYLTWVEQLKNRLIFKKICSKLVQGGKWEKTSSKKIKQIMDKLQPILEEEGFDEALV